MKIACTSGQFFACCVMTCDCCISGFLDEGSKHWQNKGNNAKISWVKDEVPFCQSPVIPTTWREHTSFAFAIWVKKRLKQHWQRTSFLIQKLTTEAMQEIIWNARKEREIKFHPSFIAHSQNVMYWLCWKGLERRKDRQVCLAYCVLLFFCVKLMISTKTMHLKNLWWIFSLKSDCCSQFSYKMVISFTFRNSYHQKVDISNFH